MAAPTPSKLDSNQILQSSFDDSVGKLRVDADINFIADDVILKLDPETDGVSVYGQNGGTNYQLSTDTQGKLQVIAQFTPITTSTSTITRVSSSATNVILSASNSSRKGLILYNESTQVCYIKLGITASASSYTVQMSPGSTFIIDEAPLYTGEIDGIWASANGSMQITELT